MSHRADRYGRNDWIRAEKFHADFPDQRQAALNFVGTQGGEKVILPLRDLDSGVADLGVKFRFRYFQEVKGTLNLPQQFVPEQVQVVLQSTGSKAQRVEESIEWPATGEA